MSTNRNDKNKLTLSDGEFALMDIIWNNEPMPSRDLVAIAEQRFGWATTTTYTILKRLITQGAAANERSVVRSLIDRGEAEIEDSKRIGEQIKRRFGGSLPKFLTTFASNNEMSRDELDEVMAVLEKLRNEK